VRLTPADLALVPLGQNTMARRDASTVAEARTSRPGPAGSSARSVRSRFGRGRDGIDLRHRRHQEVDVQRLRVGILSSAKIGMKHVIPALQNSQRCEVVAIASRDADRARRTADALGVPRAHGSYEELLDDPEVDAVYNPLPNHLHAPWTLAAADAGKHVLCEKPLARDVAEAQHMIEGCRAAGVVLMEAFMYRLHPQWVRVRELVASGRLGEVHTVQSMFAYDNRNPDDIRNTPAYGGGGLLDIGCYCIDVSRMIFGKEPIRSHGVVRVDPAFGTDVQASGLLEFPGGRQATFTCATQSAPDQRVHIIGSKAHLTVELPFNVPPDRPMRLLITPGWPAQAPEAIQVPAANQYGLQGDAFARAVIDGEVLATPPENGLGNLAVIEALRESARTT
jgi:predicted dehydrogenase